MCIYQILIIAIIVAVLLYLWRRYEGMANVQFLGLEQQFANQEVIKPELQEVTDSELKKVVIKKSEPNVVNVPVAHNATNGISSSCCFIGSEKQSPCFGNLWQ